MSNDSDNPQQMTGDISNKPAGAQAVIRPNRCEKCAFAAALASDQRFECHAGPPSLTAMLGPELDAQGRPTGRPTVLTSTNFPLVSPIQWCGMFKPKLAIEN